jgi:tripartite-type tricarboxylate transporter receptor subunit TctC
VRALGVTALTRFALLPDVPTISEAGLPGYELINWIGLVAPAQTPREIVARLNAEIARWAGDVGNQTKMAAVGFVIEPMTPAEFSDMLVRNLATTGKLMISIGFTQQ